MECAIDIKRNIYNKIITQLILEQNRVESGTPLSVSEVCVSIGRQEYIDMCKAYLELWEEMYGKSRREKFNPEV